MSKGKWNKRVTQADIADHLGLSTGTVSRYKKAGMPVGSPDAAANWCITNGMEIKNGKAKTNEKSDHNKISEEELNSDDIQGVLRRTKEAEMSAYERMNSLKGQMGYDKALSTYNSLVRARIDVEKVHNELMVAARTMVPSSTAIEVCRTVLGPLVEQLQSVPRGYAHRCNPDEPMIAEDALETMVKQLLLTVKNQCEKRIEQLKT